MNDQNICTDMLRGNSTLELNQDSSGDHSPDHNSLKSSAILQKSLSKLTEA